MDVDSKSQDQRLAQNLAALRAVGSDLPKRLAALPPEEVIPLVPGETGLPAADAHCEDGARVRLASRLDPLREARRWVDSLGGDALDKHSIAVVGCGLGYHVAELLARRKGGLVVVLEPSLGILHAALRCQEFTRDILARRLLLLGFEQRADLFETLAGHNVELMLGTHLAQHPVSARARPAACSRVQQVFAEYLHYVRSAVATTLEVSVTTSDNILRNLPVYLAWPGVDDLADAWRGLPAICVAAGPSLRYALDGLRQVKGRAMILAVQTVLKPLLAAGIRPDIVTALDYSAISSRFYEGLGELPDVTLVADPKVTPAAPDNFPGPKRMFFNAFASLTVEEVGDRRAALRAGSTVAHVNLYLARHMGCDPIILVGQDLGFGQNCYYAPGNPIHTTWSAELNRFNTLEMMEWQRIVRVRHTLRKVPGQDGRLIYTDGQMFTYIQQFERDVAQTTATVINCSRGGARVAGTVEMDFQEALDRYCGADPLVSKPAPPSRRPDADQRLAQGRQCLLDRLEELDQMEEICRQVLVPLRQMTDALNDPPRFNRLFEEMNTWRVKIDSLERIYRLVGDTAQLAEMKRFTLDHALKRKELDPIAERRQQLVRDIQYVSLIQEGVQVLRESMRAALARLPEGGQA